MRSRSLRAVQAWPPPPPQQWRAPFGLRGLPAPVSDAAAATILDPADHEQPEVSGGAAGDRAIAGIVQPKITWVRQAEDRDIGEPPGSRHAASGKAEHASGVHRTRSRMPVKILSASRVSSEVMTRPVCRGGPPALHTGRPLERFGHTHVAACQGLPQRFGP
jgi:hypothetical protein